jgi:hypothetical protein
VVKFKTKEEMESMSLREGLGLLAIVISSMFLGLARDDYQSLIQLLRGEGIPFDISHEIWVNLVDSGVNGLVTDLTIGFLFLALGIFLIMFKGTNRRLVGVLITASSLLLFTWGFHRAFSVQELAIVIISLILLAIGLFMIYYKGKSSSQIAAPSTTT